VNNNRKHASGEVARIGPSCELDLFCFLSVLAACGRQIGVAAIGTNEPINHQLERGGRPIPIHRAHDHHAVRGDPHRIDIIHPVAGLSDRVIGITTARPVAEGLCSRNASLAGIDHFSIFRGEPRQIEDLDLEAGHVSDHVAGQGHETPGFRYFTWTGLVISRRPVDDQDT
jgi:hypothetical protein